MGKPLTTSFASNKSFSILAIFVLSNLAPTAADTLLFPRAESDQNALSPAPGYYYDDLAPSSAPGPQMGLPAYEEDHYAPFVAAPVPAPPLVGEMPGESSQQQPADAADTVEADLEDDMEMNAVEGGGGGWNKEKVAGVGVGVLASACLLGIGAFVYSEKGKWRRGRSNYEALYKKNEISMSKKQEVELPMLA